MLPLLKGKKFDFTEENPGIQMKIFGLFVEYIEREDGKNMCELQVQITYLITVLICTMI